jgi:hypothetical protein
MAWILVGGCDGQESISIRRIVGRTEHGRVSLGGDADTLACIAGGIAQAYYGGVPGLIRRQAMERLDADLKGLVEEFEARFPHPG